MLGSEHPDVAGSLTNLANLHANAGPICRGGTAYKQAISLWEKPLYEKPRRPPSVNGLAILYGHLGRYVEAESLQKQALAIREKVLGPENPDVA